MELVKVAPCRHALGMVGVHRRRDKFVGGVHGNLAEVFTQAFQDDADHTGIKVNICGMVEQVE